MYFEHGKLLQEHSHSGVNNSKVDFTSANVYSVNPHVPRFQEYKMSFPAAPKTLAHGVTDLQENFPHRSAPDIPIVGIAVNGVLITSEYFNESQNKDIDNCGGFGNKAQYHYFAPPICLLLSLDATVPTTGTLFIHEDTSMEQIGHWSEVGKPSPIVGFALDGFPIYGPYNASGQLQTAGSTELNKCLFDMKNQRYHMTANYPFTPPCLVGNVGSFSRKQLNGGICTAVDGVFCWGDSCQPVNQECEDVPCELDRSMMWVFTLCVACFLMMVLIIFKVMSCLDPVGCYYPLDKIIFSVLPAVIFVVLHQYIFKAFYGVNKSDSTDFEMDMEAIDKNLNDGITAYLAVTGVLYTLIIAQIFLMVDDKFKQIRDALSEELAGCRQIVLCLQALQVYDQSAVTLKQKAINVVIWYLGALIKHWGNMVETSESMKSLDILYGSLSTVDKLCTENCPNSRFNVQVADRIIDSMNAVSSAKYRRFALEEQRLPGLLWMLQYCIATAMFLGVLMIRSGSGQLNLGMCYSVTVLIGMNTLVIADMDLPYQGLIKVRVEAIVELFDYLSGVIFTDPKYVRSLSKQTSEFFSAREDRRRSMAESANARERLMSDLYKGFRRASGSSRKRKIGAKVYDSRHGDPSSQRDEIEMLNGQTALSIENDESSRQHISDYCADEENSDVSQ